MRSLIRWRPFEDVGDLQKEMNQTFERFLGHGLPGSSDQAYSFSPAMNIAESENELIVTAELPGLESKDLDIAVQNDVLTIKGEKRHQTEDKGETWHRIESSYGTFSRSFQLPNEVDVDKVSADFKNGVLRVTLPKSAQAKRREISVSSSD